VECSTIVITSKNSFNGFPSLTALLPLIYSADFTLTPPNYSDGDGVSVSFTLVNRRVFPQMSRPSPMLFI